MYVEASNVDCEQIRVEWGGVGSGMWRMISMRRCCALLYCAGMRSLSQAVWPVGGALLTSGTGGSNYNWIWLLRWWPLCWMDGWPPGWATHVPVAACFRLCFQRSEAKARRASNQASASSSHIASGPSCIWRHDHDSSFTLSDVVEYCDFTRLTCLYLLKDVFSVRTPDFSFIRQSPTHTLVWPCRLGHCRGNAGIYIFSFFQKVNTVR